MKQKVSKRSLILDAAFELFLSKSYHDTKIIDIAEAAGIGKGTVYEYFKSKDEIFCELIQTKVADPYHRLQQLVIQEETAENKLKQYVTFELHHVAQFSFHKSMFAEGALRSDIFQNPKLRKMIHQLMNLKLSILRGIIEEGIQKKEFSPVNPVLAAVTIIGSISSFISLQMDLLPHCSALCIEQKEEWHPEEFYRILFHGLKE